ncbi:MAG: thioredoxin domain-containing protein [Candidatus Uhrbacteria bacterium]|nr:thioredoxin domain-containing protein [Candidatus Uhrbacteria bacterium]
MSSQKTLSGKHKRLALWLGVCALLVASVFIIVNASASRPSSGGSSPVASGEIAVVDASDHVRGNELAQKTLVEYSDLQCPACKAYYPILKDVEKEFGTTVRIVYRHFPLTQIHKNSLAASYATEAASKQGKFWEMHDMLFEKQELWSSGENVAETFVGYAKELGLDTEKFKTDMGSQDVKDRVKRDMNSGTAAGVPGTPTFFLNGKQIDSPRSFEAFRALLQATE